MVRTLSKTILESAERNCSRIIIDSGANINASSSLHYRKDKAAKNPQDQLKVTTGSGKALSSGTSQIRCELGLFSSAVLPALKSDTGIISVFRLLSQGMAMNGSVLLRRHNGEIRNADEQLLAEINVENGIYELQNSNEFRQSHRVFMLDSLHE